MTEREATRKAKIQEAARRERRPDTVHDRLRVEVEVVNGRWHYRYLIGMVWSLPIQVE